MKTKKRRLKRKSKFKRSEIVGFLVLGVSIIFLFYLLIPPQVELPENNLMGTSTSPSSGPLTTGGPLLRAAIVDQLSVHYPSSEFTAIVDGMMRQAGFKVDVYGPERVTVNLYGALPTNGYRLVVFRVHGGVSEDMEGRPVGLFTTEPYSEMQYSLEQLSDLVGSAQAFNSSEPVFAVTPKFIREKSVMDYDGAVIVLTGCYGLYSRELPEAFLDRGASVVIGWDRLVSMGHTDEAMLVLLRMMLIERMSIGEAVEATMREVGPDPDYGSVLSYYPLEKSSLKIPEFIQIGFFARDAGYFELAQTRNSKLCVWPV